MNGTGSFFFNQKQLPLENNVIGKHKSQERFYQHLGHGQAMWPLAASNMASVSGERF
jgi:hypothetical protein